MASILEAETRERAIEKHKIKTGLSSLYCRVCGEIIAEKRRQLLVTDLCFECAVIEEKRNKR